MRAVRTGIEAARGDVLVLLDSDDALLPGYLARLRQIYSSEPRVSFVSSKPQLGGDGLAQQRKAYAWLERIELEPGVVGSTRWATALFYEFVGVPTSGNSMRTELARKIMSLPSELDARQDIAPPLRKLLGITEAQARNSGLTADGFLVRAASLLGAIKYYDDRPGFLYRIHAGNRFAHTPPLGRWYLRQRVRRRLLEAATRQFALAPRPSASDVRAEILQRHFGRLWRRRFHIRAQYCLALLRCKGSTTERMSALSAALGLTG
jgi:glycosyltransferase involved in cell wall biosynthesis